MIGLIKLQWIVVPVTLHGKNTLSNLTIFMKSFKNLWSLIKCCDLYLIKSNIVGKIILAVVKGLRAVNVGGRCAEIRMIVGVEFAFLIAMVGMVVATDDELKVERYLNLDM